MGDQQRQFEGGDDDGQPDDDADERGQRLAAQPEVRTQEAVQRGTDDDEDDDARSPAPETGQRVAQPAQRPTTASEPALDLEVVLLPGLVQQLAGERGQEQEEQRQQDALAE